MNKLNTPCTVGIWTVKAGKERSFIEEWSAFARWSLKNQPGAVSGYLLQDATNPQRFVSFGNWENLEVIKEWREHPEFKAFVEKVKILCEDFQPYTMKLAAASEASE